LQRIAGGGICEARMSPSAVRIQQDWSLIQMVCANCEEVITGDAVESDGEQFCCAGCANGGPCICTYGHQPVTHSTLLQSQPESARLAWPTPQIPLGVASRPSILRVNGLGTQMDLLRLGYALEQQPAIEDLSLVRAELEDVWFAVTVGNSEDLAEALARIDGFRVDARPHSAGVDATVEVIVPERAPAVAEATQPEPAAVSPRPRFRLFHRAASVPVAPQPPNPERPAPVEPAAAQPTYIPRPEPAYAAPEPAYAVPESRPVVQAEPAPQPAIAAASVSGGTWVEAPMSATGSNAPAPGMLGVDARPGGAVAMREHLTVVAYPFRSFVALNEFQDAMRALHGVINVKVRRFYRGTLHLGVEYEDVIPLAERMRELQGFTWRLVSASQQEIELMLEEQGDLASSG
jgi:hypothetical protein